MNDVLRRRLIGLAVLLALVFLLSLLLPGAPLRDQVEPSTTVSLSGEILQVTEADAVPPPDDYLPQTEASTALEAPPPTVEMADESVAIADPDSAVEPDAAVPVVIEKPAPAPSTKLKLAPEVSKPRDEATAAKSAPKPPLAKAPAAVVTPKPKLAESVARPPGGIWFVQIGSFSDAGTASTIAGLIRKQGFPASTSTITGAKGKTLHRVRAGPYSNEAAARGARSRLAGQGYPQAQVLSEASR